MRSGQVSAGAVSRRAAFLSVGGAAMTGLGLAGCTETLTATAAGSEKRTPVVAAGDVPISIESLDGGDAAFRSRFTAALTEAASLRKISLVGPQGAPRYRLRAYLDATRGSDGKPALVWVYDVYDQSKQRTRRIEGSAPASGAGDPWAAVDAALVKRAADESMDDVAEFLISVAKDPTPTPATGPARTPVAAAD